MKPALAPVHPAVDVGRKAAPHASPSNTWAQGHSAQPRRLWSVQLRVGHGGRASMPTQLLMPERLAIGGEVAGFGCRRRASQSRSGCASIQVRLRPHQGVAARWRAPKPDAATVEESHRLLWETRRPCSASRWAVISTSVMSGVSAQREDNLGPCLSAASACRRLAPSAAARRGAQSRPTRIAMSTAQSRSVLASFRRVMGGVPAPSPPGGADPPKEVVAWRLASKTGQHRLNHKWRRLT